MTIPFGEDDLSFINSQIEGVDQQFGGANRGLGLPIGTPFDGGTTDMGDSTGGAGSSGMAETFTGAVDQGSTTTGVSNTTGGGNTGGSGITLTRGCQGDGDCPNGSFCDFSNTTIIGDDLTNQYGTCKPLTGSTDAGGGTDAGTTATCEPPSTLLRCGQETPFGVIGIFSNGLQNGVCSEYSQLTDLCPSSAGVGSSGGTGTGGTGTGGTGTGGGTQPVPVCPEGSTQCGPSLTINANESSAMCCSNTDTCCYDGTSYYCSSGPCNGTGPGKGDGGGGKVGTDPCNGCPPGYECRKAEVGGHQCINPLEDPCANNGPCGDPEYSRCSYVQGGNSATCISVKQRVFWTACETGVEINGTPPSDLVVSSDIFGRTCYRPADIKRAGYRLCGSTDIQTGSPPVGSISTSDANGACYQQPTTWRRCGASFQPQAGAPPAGLGLAVDDFGQCYDDVWVSCGNPTFNNRGLPPINYEFDQARSCWREKTVNIAPATCGGNTYGECPSGQICIPFTVPFRGINYVCTTPPREELPEITQSTTTPQPETVTTPQPETVTTPQVETTVTLDNGQEIILPPIKDEPPKTPPPLPPPPTPRITWKECISGDLKDGLAPTTYREVAYTGPGGGTCWEPSTVIGFSPSLQEALYFTHQRGSGNYPQPKTITATNPSYGVSYSIKINTNASIIVQPSAFTLEPRSSVDFIVNVTPELVAQLGDGKSTLSMTVEIKEL